MRPGVELIPRGWVLTLEAVFPAHCVSTRESVLNKRGTNCKFTSPEETKISVGQTLINKHTQTGSVWSENQKHRPYQLGESTFVRQSSGRLGRTATETHQRCAPLNESATCGDLRGCPTARVRLTLKVRRGALMELFLREHSRPKTLPSRRCKKRDFVWRPASRRRALPLRRHGPICRSAGR